MIGIKSGTFKTELFVWYCSKETCKKNEWASQNF